MAKNEKIVRTVIHAGQQPTEAQIKEIEAAMTKPVVPDEDTPELPWSNMQKWRQLHETGEAVR